MAWPSIESGWANGLIGTAFVQALQPLRRSTYWADSCLAPQVRIRDDIFSHPTAPQAQPTPAAHSHATVRLDAARQTALGGVV